MNVLICDDSSVARNIMHRTITRDYNVNVLFAENGQDALDIIADNPVDLLFLDLAMPVLDGFALLHSLSLREHNTKVIVVSDHVKEDAIQRCLDLGAKDFISKPFKKEQLRAIFEDFDVQLSTDIEPQVLETILSPGSKFNELNHTAIFTCASYVSDKAGEDIQLLIPSVGVYESKKLYKKVTDTLKSETLISVAQRFTGGGIHGQALVTISGEGISDIGDKLGFPETFCSSNEQVLNMSNLFVSSYIKALSDQIATQFSIRQPTLFSRMETEQLEFWRSTKPAFFIALSFTSEKLDFHCDVLLLIDTRSISVIHKLMETK